VKEMAAPKSGTSVPGNPEREVYYKRQFRKFVFLTAVSSIIPLLILGWIFNYYYTEFVRERTKASFVTQLEQHCKLVDLFLQEQVAKLELAVRNHAKDFLADETNLSAIFVTINEKRGAFTDLGLIDSEGRHLAYVGPYDLMDKNYSNSFWFQEIMTGPSKQVYISDMFLGFRDVPHFIIAVMGTDGIERWILRATIETEVFRRIVEDVKIGSTGEVFLLNTKGVYQSNPSRGGKMLETSVFPVMPFTETVKVEVGRFGTGGNPDRPAMQIASYVWLNNPRWMLVMRQDYSEALYDVNHVNYVMLVILHASAFMILVVTIFITRYMIRAMRKRDVELDRANECFFQASKLASVGELSAGVAHEINNPLAIINFESQILADMEKESEMAPGFREQLLKSLARISNQVKRCKRLTHNLLKFSRQTESVISDVDVNSLIADVIPLVEREASTSGIRLIMEPEPDLPRVSADSSQLQQVFLNLITNAIDAHNQTGYGSVRISTKANAKDKGVDVLISDTGSGIPPEIIDKIFDPFFTTKPVGKGTGLGLSICYGIVSKLGGHLSVESKHGEGSVFTVFLPFEPPQGQKKPGETEQKTTH
jgi:two-component system NtrC family sensor kinase